MIGQWTQRGGESQASVVIREVQININMRHYYLIPWMAIKKGGGREGRRRMGRGKEER